MARQEHEHGFLGDIGQAYARDVSGGIEAQGRPQADPTVNGSYRCVIASAKGTGSPPTRHAETSTGRRSR